jgi:hypothetical protein
VRRHLPRRSGLELVLAWPVLNLVSVTYIFFKVSSWPKS